MLVYVKMEPLILLCRLFTKTLAEVGLAIGITCSVSSIWLQAVTWLLR